MPVEKCDKEHFFVQHISYNKPCILENSNSAFYQKTNFVLNKSKLLDEGLLELKKSIDQGNVQKISPIFMKKELLGVMNMLGTPKFASMLLMENMHMEFVLKS